MAFDLIKQTPNFGPIRLDGCCPEVACIKAFVEIPVVEKVREATRLDSETLKVRVVCQPRSPIIFELGRVLDHSLQSVAHHEQLVRSVFLKPFDFDPQTPLAVNLN